MSNNKTNQIIIKVGETLPYKGSEDFFTGNVTVQPLFQDNEEISVTAAYVTFEPGARTAWHTHPCGQRLIVTQGIGLTAEANGQVHEFKAGDVIICPKEVKHWHGATPHSKMTHIALTGVKDGRAVEWMEKVTEEEYNSKTSS